MEYAKWIAGEITSKNDGAACAMFEEKAPGAIVSSNYTNADGQTFDNYYSPFCLALSISTTTLSNTR